MKKILVPIDGSEYSIAAVKEAKKYAEAFSSEIVLLTVANYNVYIGPDLTGVVVDIEQFTYHAKTEAENNLAKAKEALGDLAAKAETVLLYGDPADQIIDYLEKSDADLVVMGSQGMGFSAAKRLFVGSVTFKVLHNSSKPVLVVK